MQAKIDGDMADVSGTSPHAGEFRRGWPILLASLLGIGCGLAAMPFYTAGVFAPHLVREFGWSLGQIMAGLTITTVTVIVAAPVTGALCDRYGTRPIAIASLAFFGLAYLSLAALGNSLIQFYATWAIAAALGAGTLPITFTRTVNQWFDRHRGLALGIAILSASAATAQLLPQLSSPLGATIGRTLEDVGEDAARPLRSGLDGVDSALQRLRQARLDSLSALVRRNPDDLALDLRGDPAIRDELLLVDPDAGALDAARQAGFGVIGDDRLEGLDIRTVRLRPPANMDLSRAERRLRQAARGATIQSNPIYRTVGTATPQRAAAPAARSKTRSGAIIGLIDGGVAGLSSFSGSVTSRGFATGAGRQRSCHGHRVDPARPWQDSRAGARWVAAVGRHIWPRSTRRQRAGDRPRPRLARRLRSAYHQHQPGRPRQSPAGKGDLRRRQARNHDRGGGGK